MPGGDPATWSIGDLTSAVSVLNKERQFMMNLAHYVAFWITSCIKPGKLEAMDILPENFIKYIEAKKAEPRNKKQISPDQKKYIDKRADLILYQNYHKRKAKRK